ncbi:MAG: hypothetical protein ACXVCY_12085 [Pseudobdellovibrionaceae bacterium]
MQTLKAFPFVLVTLSLILFSPFWSTLVQAADHRGDYEEVSYDDLLNELNAKKSRLAQKETSSFDEIRLHAGIGYANSFTNIATQNQYFTRHATGIQLAVGMDLFSPNWYSEGIFKNYGVTTYGSEEMSLREFDLKLGYTNKLQSIWNYSISSGLSNRFLHFKDFSKNIDIDSTTPSLIVSTGFSAQVLKNVSLGTEVSVHSAIISQTADKNSFDFAFRLTTSM